MIHLQDFLDNNYVPTYLSNLRAFAVSCLARQGEAEGKKYLREATRSEARGL